MLDTAFDLAAVTRLGNSFFRKIMASILLAFCAR